LLLHVLDLFGVAVFAVSGALTAGRKRLDVFGVLVIAAVAAVGGGTLRDVLLGHRPFWMADMTYLTVSSAAAIATILAARQGHFGRRRLFQALLVADAFGLALFAATGARVAHLAGVGPVVATFLGAMTGVAGGAMRDVLCAEVPLILRRHIYATAALAGAGVYVLAAVAGVTPSIAIAAGATTAFVLRLAAIGWGLHLPVIDLSEGEAPTAKPAAGGEGAS
jgi:uncharacterized membrane protein YeiH